MHTIALTENEKDIWRIIMEDNSIKIYLEGLLHLSLKQSELVGFQSWKPTEADGMYCIEFYMKGNTILCEYVNEKLWCNVLGLLEYIPMAA